MKRKMRKLGLFTLFVLILGSPVWADGWWLTTVDTTMDSGIGGTSIVLDSFGIPHVAYRRYNGASTSLIYASFNPADSSWSYEVVFDSAKIKMGKVAGSKPSLQLDSKGYPHISFWWGCLGYAWKDSTGWHLTKPDSIHWINCTSLALDSNDKPHFGYSWEYWCDGGPYDWLSVVAYTYHNGIKWETEVIDTVGFHGGGDVSIALDTNDCPHIAYPWSSSGCWIEWSRRGIKYAKRGDELWYIEVIDTIDTLNNNYSVFPSMVINSFSRPCIAYCCVTKGLSYAIKDNKGWEIVRVDSGLYAGYETFLYLDTNDNPHISYENDGWLKYVWSDGKGWYISEVDLVGSGGLASYTGLVLDSEDYAHISYHKANRIRYAKGYAMGVEEFSWKKDYLEPMLKVYPNPFMGYLNIHAVKCEVEIYDLSGRLIGKADNGIWNGRDSAGKEVQSGIYFLRAKGYQPVKVVKLK